MKLLLAGPTGELDIDGANQQRVQLWKWNETMRALTMLPRLGAAAERLAGMRCACGTTTSSPSRRTTTGQPGRTRTCRCGRWATRPAR